MKLNKTETMWVVVNGRGDVVPDSLSRFKKYSINALTRAYGGTWNYWKKCRYSCIKVLVTISRKEEIK